uniref:glycosyltransferase family 2 protein n=1 Tax=Mariniflexile sp. TaxID=1979402 RepID=UPI0040485AA9
MSQPLVSIIIPTYNRAYLINETLDSVLAQTYTNWECIVVDDGSVDETEQLLYMYCKKDNRFQYHHRPDDRPNGANACRNYGFELSKGEYVNWFDDDDVMLEDFIKTKVSLFSPEVDLVICSGYFVDELLQNRRIIDLNESANLFKEYVLWTLQILTPSILFKRSFIEGKELFSYKISRGQEAELFSRLFFQLSKESYLIVNLPFFLYRQHPNTKTAKNNEYVKSYKESQSFIAIENFKKAIKIKDRELTFYYYKVLIEYYFRGIENNHLNNSKFILTHLIQSLRKLNIILSFELFFFGGLFLVLKKGSYRIEKRFRNYKVLIDTTF